MIGFPVILSGATVGSEVEGFQLSAPRFTTDMNMREPVSRSFDSDSHHVLVSAQDDGWFDSDSHSVLVFAQDDGRFDSDSHSVLVFAQEDAWEAMR